MAEKIKQGVEIRGCLPLGIFFVMLLGSLSGLASMAWIVWGR